MRKAKQRGDAILESAVSVHFIPSDTGMEIPIETLVDMKVGTAFEGTMRIRTPSATEYVEGAVVVMAKGIHFQPLQTA